MRKATVARSGARRWGGSLITGCLLLLGAALATGQDSRPGREPRLPGALTQAPSWIGKAPFDVEAFFAMPPPSQNAAPLYLDALFEFGDEMAVCFPPEQRGRAAAAKLHGERIDRAYTAWYRDHDPARLDRAEIDALTVVMRNGLRKLDLAQGRPRCVFAEGLAWDSPLPHSNVARRVIRLWTLQIIRALDRGDLDAALGFVRRILRLTRDLRPRGAAADQFVSWAFDRIAGHELAPLVLQHPKLQVRHCDRLLGLLSEHQAQAIDSLATGLQANDLLERGILRTLEEGIALSTDAQGRAIEKRLNRDDVVRYFIKLVEYAAQSADPSKKVDPRNLANPQFIQKAAAQLDSLKLDFRAERRALDDWTASLLAVRTAPYPEQARQIAGLEKRYFEGRPTRDYVILKLTFPDFRRIASAHASGEVSVRAAQCLIAVRRWELIRKGQASSLAEACRSAGLARVPIDPYGGTPLRLSYVAHLAEKPVFFEGRRSARRHDFDATPRSNTTCEFPLRETPVFPVKNSDFGPVSATSCAT